MHIKAVFPEEYLLALDVANCESQFVMQQSRLMQPYGRERSFGIFQIHEPDWHQVAIELGLPNYQTDVEENIAMARHIYDQHGWQPWTCYKQLRHVAYVDN